MFASAAVYRSATSSSSAPALGNTFANAAGAYRQIGVETGATDASPHRLITLLFDGFTDAVAQASLAMQQGDFEAKGRFIGRSVNIVEQGLKGALDVQAGGALAVDLQALYGYISLRLTQANLHNDPRALEECVRLMEPLRTAWVAIGPSVDGVQ